MPPIDLETFTRQRFHANVSSLRCAGADGTQIVFQYGESALIAQWPEPLGNDGSVGLRVLLEQLGDGGFKRIQSARPWTADRRHRRSGEKFGDGPPVEFQMTRNLAEGPAFQVMEPVNGINLFRTGHGSVLYTAGEEHSPKRCSFQDGPAAPSGVADP